MRSNPYLLRTAAITASVLAGCIAPAFADTADTPSVTPYRPSVSTPAALSAPGWLELEAGLMQTRAAASAHQETLPYTLKLAFSPDWGVRIGGDAYVRDTDSDGVLQHGGGDTAIVLKRRFALNDTAAFGLEAGANFPTARKGLGSGKTDYSLNGIFSADLGDYHTDINLLATRLGAPEPDTGRIQSGWAAALSHPLSERWGAVGEFSGTRQPGAPSTAQLLTAVSYNLSPAVALDAGLAHGLNSASDRWSFFAGMTMLLAKLF